MNSQQDSIKAFISVRKIALHAFKDQQRQSGRALRSLYAITRIHYWLVAIGCYLLGIVVLIQPLGGRLLALGLPKEPSWLNIVVAVIVWTLAIAPISGWVSGAGVKYPWVLLLYTLLGIPALMIIAEGFVTSNWATLSQNLILLPTFSLTFLLLVTGMLVMVSGSMPLVLFLFVTSVHAGDAGKIFPSYETLIGHVIAAIKSDTESIYSRDHVGQIALIAQQKQSGLDIRTQTIGLIFAILALFSLFQLTLAQNDVAENLNVLLRSLLMFIGVSTPTLSASGVLIFGIVVFGLVLSGLKYGVAAYLELRLLEAINLYCSLHLLKEEISSSSSQHTYPSATKQTSVPFAQTQDQLQTSLGLFGWTVLIGIIIYRAATSLVKRSGKHL